MSTERVPAPRQSAAGQSAAPKSAPRVVALLLGLALGIAATFALAQRGEAFLRALLIYLSRARWARQLVTGFAPAWAVASRFVAGESIDQAIAVARDLERGGMLATVDYLGESVTDAADAADARDHILDTLDRIHASGLSSYVSIKLTQLGLEFDENLALSNLRAILARARRHGLRVRIDMEDSRLTEITLDIYRTMRHKEGFANVGIVIQSYLYRSDGDIQALVQEGAWVRLVKGAYAEPPAVAYEEKSATDAAFVRQMEMLLSPAARARGVFVAIATHDDKMIEATLDAVRRMGIGAHEFEFQMLYGIGRERQRALVAQGWTVRLYVPYGTAWYPYFVRRLAERPANLWFFVSALFRS